MDRQHNRKKKRQNDQADPENPEPGRGIAQARKQHGAAISERAQNANHGKENGEPADQFRLGIH